MQNPIQKFRQSSTVFEKPGFLSEKSKSLTSSNYHRGQYFLLKLRTRFQCLPMSTKGCSGFFVILFRPWVIWKKKKDLVSTQWLFTFLLITQDLNKIKKSRTPFCRHC